VLDADVEVDRRDFTVRAAVRVAPGERLALFGPSGAGKSTILEAIAGLARPRRARIVLNDRMLTSTAPPVRAVPPWRRRIGLLRQDPGLFPHLSVRDNLAYAPAAGRWGAELADLAGVLGLGGLLSAMPARLSGGQAHRVALGRLLLAHCDALLLDEPYTGLDAGLRRTLTDLVAGLVAERRVPAMLVAHELPDAQAFADRLAVLDRGCLLQVGAPDEVVLRPASRRVAELVGYLGFVPVRDLPGLGPVPGGAGDTSRMGGDGNGRVAGSAAGGHAVAGIHPERVAAGARPGSGLVLTGAVRACRPAGAGWEADLRVGDVTITCRLPEKPATADGELVVTALDPPYFGADGAALDPASGWAHAGGRDQPQRVCGLWLGMGQPMGPGRRGPPPNWPARRATAPRPRARAAACGSGWPARPGVSPSSNWPGWPVCHARRSPPWSPACPTRRSGWRWPWRACSA
jgi:molybdate transport system ATP-binding protein